MALDRIRGLFGRPERAKYSFELVSKSLLREDRKELVTRIAAVKSAQGAEKIAKTNQLASYVSSLFEDVKVEASEANLSDFIRTFAKEADAVITDTINQLNSTVASVANENMVATDEGERPEGEVPLPRRVTTDIFKGVEPVAKPPRTASEREDAAIDRVLRGVDNAGSRPTIKEIPALFKEEPLHRASKDSIHSSNDAVIEWKPPTEKYKPEGPERKTL